MKKRVSSSKSTYSNHINEKGVNTMNEKTPQMGPAGSQQYSASASTGDASPTATPPPGAASAGAKSDCGCGGGAASAWTSVAAPNITMMSQNESAPTARLVEG